MGIGYGSVRKSVEGYCSYLQPPTIQSSHVAIAMYLTLCAMLLRCSAMCLLGGVCELRWIAGGMCDLELLSAMVLLCTCATYALTNVVVPDMDMDKHM